MFTWFSRVEFRTLAILIVQCSLVKTILSYFDKGTVGLYSHRVLVVTFTTCSGELRRLVLDQKSAFPEPKIAGGIDVVQSMKTPPQVL